MPGKESITAGRIRPSLRALPRALARAWAWLAARPAVVRLRARAAARADRLRARGREWLRALPASLRRTAETHLYGFGTLDALYFALLYTFGAYFVIDTIFNLLLFALYFRLVTSERAGARRLALFVMLSVTVLLALSGVLIWLLPRLTPTSTYVRVLHQTVARYAILVTVPYLVLHVKTPLAGVSPRYRRATRAAFATLKVSLWIAAIPALLTIKGQFVIVHTIGLAVGLPLLAYHVIAPALRRARATAAASPAVEPIVQPFPVLPLLSRPMSLAASLVACLPIGAAIGLGVADFFDWGRVYAPVPAYVADLTPSPATTADGAVRRPELLGESNGCGQDPCHPVVFPQWAESPHRDSAGPAYQTALERVVRGAGLPTARFCAGCHDPIALLSGSIEPGAPLTTPESVREGVSCLVCHGLEGGPAGANGGYRFHFPRSYYVGSVSLPSLVGTGREHSGDFRRPFLGDDGACVACHRFQPLPAALASEPALVGWLAWPEHAQATMIEACRTGTGCVGCHMPSVSNNEKPWTGPLPLHQFWPASVAAERYFEVWRDG